MADSAATRLQNSVKNPSASSVAYFESVVDAFEQGAAAVGGAIDRFYAIGGYTIRLRFAGRALLPCLTRALAHLSAKPTSTPALTIDILDSASTGMTVTRPPWQVANPNGRGEILGFNDRRIRGSCQTGVDYCSLLDVSQDQAIYWLSDYRDIPYWECGAPLRVILHWWMGERGLHFVHAAAVGTRTGGVLLGGRGGSGKSTTALAGLDGGLTYVSDDYCLISLNPAPHAHSLYSSAKLNADNVERFPRLAATVSNADRLDSEKAVLYLHERYADRIATTFAIRAVLLTRVTGRPDTRLSPATAAEGLKAIAPSTIFQLPGAGLREFQALARLVREVPVLTPGGRNGSVSNPHHDHRPTGKELTMNSQRFSASDVPPLVSVVIAVRNGERFLSSAVESVLEQDYQPFEIIVVDGHSTDRTAEIVRSYRQLRYVSQANRGVADAWNVGIDASRGELIAFLSHDDRWTPDKLRVQVSYMQTHREVEYTIARVKFVLQPGFSVPPGFRRELLEGDHVGQLMETLVVWKSLFTRIGKFDPNLRTAEDADWYARANDARVPRAVLPQVLLIKRVHDENTSLNDPVGNQNLLTALKRSVDRKRSQEATPHGHD